MLKFFLSKRRRPRPAPVRNDDSAANWICDPLAHPAIAAMDERERADLPFRTFPTSRDRCADAMPGQNG